jgi:hypothetical protein
MLKFETRDSALARVGRALADPTRCRILVSLLDGACYPVQLAESLGLSRSNVSKRLEGLLEIFGKTLVSRYALTDSVSLRMASRISFSLSWGSPIASVMTLGMSTAFSRRALPCSVRETRTERSFSSRRPRCTSPAASRRLEQRRQRARVEIQLDAEVLHQEVVLLPECEHD